MNECAFSFPAWIVFGFILPTLGCDSFQSCLLPSWAPRLLQQSVWKMHTYHSVKIAFCRDSTKKPRCIKCSCHSSPHRLDGKTFAYGTAWRHGTANVARLAAVHRAQRRRFFLIIILFRRRSPHLIYKRPSEPLQAFKVHRIKIRIFYYYYFFIFFIFFGGGLGAVMVDRQRGWLLLTDTQGLKVFKSVPKCVAGTACKEKDTDRCS